MNLCIHIERLTDITWQLPISTLLQFSKSINFVCATKRNTTNKAKSVLQNADLFKTRRMIKIKQKHITYNLLNPLQDFNQKPKIVTILSQSQSFYIQSFVLKYSPISFIPQNPDRCMYSWCPHLPCFLTWKLAFQWVELTRKCNVCY